MRVTGLVAATAVLSALVAAAPSPGLAQDDADAVTLSVVAGDDIRFTALTAEEGLSSGSVYDIAQDEQGFMWFATGDGLSRYDGYSFRVFRFDRDDPNSLASNIVVGIQRGRGNVLWLGTSSGGVDRFDPATETFTHYRHDPDDPNSLSGNSTVGPALYEDSQGMVWIGTAGSGLNRLDPATETFTHYRHDPDDPTSLSSDLVTSVHEDADGLLWIGTQDAGLNRLDPDTGDITRYLPDPDDPHALPDPRVSGVFEDSTGTLWVGTQNGFASLDRETGRFTHYVIAPDQENTASLNAVGHFHEDAAGNLWLPSGGAGILRFDRDRQQVVQYSNDPADPTSLRNNFIGGFWEDPSGTIWVGTFGGGVNVFSTRPPKFAHHRHEADNPNSVADNFILSIYEDQTGIVWIGNDRTLNRWDRQSDTWQVYRNDPDDPTSISNGSVTATQEDPDGTLWFGTYLGGLNRLDPETGEFTAYMFDPDDPHSLSDDVIRALYRDADGTLWVGGWAEGLNRFDRDTETFQRYSHDPDDPASLSSDSITDIYRDRSETMWVGTEGGGLNRFDPDTETFTRIRNDPEDPASLPDDAVLVLYEDLAGQFWVGTVGGLCALDRGSDTCTTVYTEREGLPNNTIEGILEDEEGNLWISTNNGLSRFDPRTETFRNYDVLDGLQSNEFNVFTAFHQGPRTGEMYFGGINGFNVFDPGQVEDNPFVPPVVLTDFRLFGESVPVGDDSVLHEAIGNTTSLSLAHDQNSISFEFAALSYVAPDKNQYRYMLEGFDAGWRTVDSDERLAVYTNLDPGDYVFRVQGTNEDGVWNEVGRSVQITIAPPWWATWWFRLMVGVAVVGALAAAYVLRLRGLRLRTAELEAQVDQRTLELRAAKDQADSANRSKSVFLANMSHELRTPLNAILGYAEILERDVPRDGPGPSRLSIVKRSGEHLLGLINDVLDLAKIEAEKLELTLAPVHVATFLEQILDVVRVRAGAKGVSLRLEAETALPDTVLADERRLRQVLLNLLGNAVRFTDDGAVTLRVSASDAVESAPDAGRQRSCRVRFEVRDTGTGIMPDHLTAIFEPFEQRSEPDRRGEGTGLGLAISQQLVQLMGGRLEATSEVGRGSTFWFEVDLPVVDVPAPVPVPGSTRPRVVGYEGSRRRVLVVDDNRFNRQLLVELLEPLGFEVATAGDGRRALDVVEEWQPDAVVLDQVMPEVTGAEVAREINRRPDAERPKIIGVSASVLDDDKAQSLVDECDAFLPKPIDTDALLDVLATQLKLTWIHAESTAMEPPVALVLPPADEVRHLSELARAGRIVDIREQLTRIADLDDAYHPFVDRMRDLAQRFELDEIAALADDLPEVQSG